MIKSDYYELTIKLLIIYGDKIDDIIHDYATALETCF